MNSKALKYVRRDQRRKVAANRQRIRDAQDADREESERLFQLNRQIEADRQAQRNPDLRDKTGLF